MAKARSGRGTCHTASPDASQLRSDSRSPFSSSNSHTSEALSGPLLHYPSQATLTSQSAYCMPTLTAMTETKQVTVTNMYWVLTVHSRPLSTNAAVAGLSVILPSVQQGAVRLHLKGDPPSPVFSGKVKLRFLKILEEGFWLWQWVQGSDWQSKRLCNSRSPFPPASGTWGLSVPMSSRSVFGLQLYWLQGEQRAGRQELGEMAGASWTVLIPWQVLDTLLP